MIRTGIYDTSKVLRCEYREKKVLSDNCIKAD